MPLIKRYLRDLEGAARLENIQDTALPVVRRIVEQKKDEVPLGQGAERVVYDYGGKRIISFFSRDPSLPKVYEGTPEQQVESLKQKYFARKLAKMLFPENVPNVSLVGSRPPMMIGERIHPRSISRVRLKRQAKEKKSFDRLLEKFNEAGIGVEASIP